jgi:predicted transcriptional regulator
MKHKLTPWGMEVKKRLIDMNMTQVDFCKKYGIPRNRLSELLTGSKPNCKHKKVVDKVLKMDEIA